MTFFESFKKIVPNSSAKFANDLTRSFTPKYLFIRPYLHTYKRSGGQQQQEQKDLEKSCWRLSVGDRLTEEIHLYTNLSIISTLSYVIIFKLGPIRCNDISWKPHDSHSKIWGRDPPPPGLTPMVIAILENSSGEVEQLGLLRRLHRLDSARARKHAVHQPLSDPGDRARSIQASEG